MRHRLSPADQIRRHWFPIGILISIILASIFPHVGSTNELMVRHGCVGLIFFLSGLAVTPAQLLAAARNHKLLAFAQGFSWLAAPLAAQLLGLAGLLGPWARRGALAAACVPPAPAAALVLAQAAGGSPAPALVNAALGTLLGIVLTPLLLFINLGWTTLLPPTHTLLHLCLTSLVPLALAQLVRRQPRLQRPLRMVARAPLAQAALLLLVFRGVAGAGLRARPDLQPGAADVLRAVLAALLLQLALLAGCVQAARAPLCGFTRDEVPAAVFCATQKSVELGLPMLRVMYHGLSHLGQSSLPLLVFQPTQVLLGGFAAAALKPWVQQPAANRLPL